MESATVGYSKHRTWRKLHLSVDEVTQTVEAVVLTEAGVDDAQAGCGLLEETVGAIGQVSGDGSYDKRKFYDACVNREVQRITIPVLATVVIQGRMARQAAHW